MNTPPPPKDFDVSVDPAPKAKVIDAEPLDDEEKRKLEAAAASSYDPAHTHDGKTDEEMMEERHDAELAVAGAAIVGGIIIAHELSEHDDDIDASDDADGD